MSIAKNIVFLVNGVDIAGAITSFNVAGDVEELDATTVADSGYRTYVSGFKSAEITVQGLWDSDTTNADEIHDVMSSAYSTGAEKNITASTGTIAVGDPAIMMDACQMTYDIPADVGALILANGRFKSTTGMRFGRWLMHSLQAAGTNNGTSYDNGAATTNGGFMQVHLFNDDASDVDVKVQHSTNNSVWADLTGAAVNNLSATHTSGSATVAAGTTVNRYLRAVATVTGGDTFLVSVAFARG